MTIKEQKQNNFWRIEKKWQKIWEKTKIYQASPCEIPRSGSGKAAISQGKDFLRKPKYYILDMFPYPSGEGLHVGHPRSYTATDVIYRYLKMKGYNVLQPMGWDAFGLPAENYAIKTGVQPAITTKKNIKRFKEQLKSIGFAYDWSKEISTADPDYYKWTQWIFLKLFEHGLAYIAEMPINWCPSCKTGLANEEVEGGKCFRCGTQVIRKKIKQWVLKITAYADRLLKDLEDLDWPEPIKLMQRNWIGRSEGSEIKFEIIPSGTITVFTTRIDTIFGVTALVVAPEHQIILDGEQSRTILNWIEVKKYLADAEKKSELERTELQKEKTGVELKGIKAINPATGEKIPIWVGDYVIATYGGGAVMVVPAHDQRDYDFAVKYGLPIKEVIKSKEEVRPKVGLRPWVGGAERDEKGNLLEAYEGEGDLINSGRFSGLFSPQAREELTKWLAAKNLGGRAIKYKFRDWIFSRQRYWGEPIPLVFCENCAAQIEARINADKEQINADKAQINADKTQINADSQRKSASGQRKSAFSKGELLNPGWIALPQKDLPLVLPKVRAYQPTGTGESPLANIKKWVETKCPKCGGKARRETNTMPQWAGSCWYYLRYVDPRNKKELINPKKEKYWLPVDCYVGGAEHAVLHLLYARFWHKFLYDLGVVSSREPFLKLRNQGMILGEDGEKMSKSRGNVVNPDEIIKKYGADVLRVYEMFMGPFEGAIPWSTKSIEGVKRFLERVKKIVIKKGRSAILALAGQAGQAGEKDNSLIRHRTIKKVTEDILNFKFNTAISSLMEYLNSLEQSSVNLKDLEVLLLLLSPFAPHLTEELWHKMRINADNKAQINADKAQINADSQRKSASGQRKSASGQRKSAFSSQRKSASSKSIFEEKWPDYQEELTQSEEVEIIIQVNGKLRDKITVKRGTLQEEVEKGALQSPQIQKFLENKQIKKTIFVKDRLINFVV